ncbi:DNA repair protein RadA [Candidatus Beckwithbacteria bacterium CG23_combo_of_CG06-09_8_20_14_all_47_9]|uniref:DNA repair protein RadA n=1 Tax=Candidatus Beckwithbacteria bacterium CG23_combo_of_CG06-09_8_20_14_all_47_9 TaxID=1974498 RepID=A0A2H0B2M8_9BACT|nr:MAG: DNA repair protein RadA [Candidatus Beckwithbacteria bacterium CG23_combo_of_CG06-09_8_20_14_all_47_9]
MPKTSTRFVCQNCGNEALKWAGRCNGCGEWNTLVETTVSTTRPAKRRRSGTISSTQPIKFTDVKGKEFVRVKSGIGELDRVLGGGLVPGSVVLLAGEPGIGKSTLLTQLALKVEGSDPSTLYVCGEESPEQIKMRILRLKFTSEVKKSATSEVSGLSFLPTTDVDEVIASAGRPGLLIVDSIQTMATTDLTGMAGSVGQIRECAFRLLNYAKETGTVVFLVGHITKEGVIAGPKILEHLVDTVLYLEGDRRHEFRILRSQKNRFGSVDEVGVFLMNDSGLSEVTNPSDIFLEERQTNVAGSCVAVVMEGTRPMLVEIQALVVPSQLAVPRRVGSGIDLRRLTLLTAVLSKRLKLPLGSYDVFVNVAGGLNLKEPAADLAVCLAVVSSLKNKPVGAKTAVFGEVGLLGEIRQVSFAEKRLREAKKLGYKPLIHSSSLSGYMSVFSRA